MTEMTDDLVVAHQFGAAFGQELVKRLPPGVALVALDPARAYDVPDEARVLFVVPPRGQIVVPEAAPVAWPRRLEWVHTASAGVDEYPPWLFEVPRVTCGRGVNSDWIAEFVMASLLAVEKRFPDAWISSAEAWTHINLGTLVGKTLGLLGFGSIGRAVAKRAAAFGMRILAHTRSGTTTEDIVAVDFATLLGEADHLVIAAPLTDATRNLLGDVAFRRMKPGSHVVNISRGGIIDQAALLNALESGHLRAASLDVTEPEPLPDGHPFYRHPRIHLSPHVSWSGGAPVAVLDPFLENVGRFMAGAELLNEVPPGRGY